jgi:DNA-binding NtrC family response regulator
MTGVSNKEADSLKNIMHRVEKNMIKEALAQVNGNKTKAAEILQMNRKAFYRKTKRLDLL